MYGSSEQCLSKWHKCQRAAEGSGTACGPPQIPIQEGWAGLHILSPDRFQAMLLPGQVPHFGVHGVCVFFVTPVSVHWGGARHTQVLSGTPRHVVSHTWLSYLFFNCESNTCLLVFLAIQKFVK